MKFKYSFAKETKLLIVVQLMKFTLITTINAAVGLVMDAYTKLIRNKKTQSANFSMEIIRTFTQVWEHFEEVTRPIIIAVFNSRCI